jgi:Rrf2 family protein
MLKINKKVEYALMALKHIASRDDSKLISARELCDHFKTPFDTTAKVLQIMNTHGILSSVKGIKGGYALARPLSQVSTMELIRIVEGDEGEIFCQGHNGLCDLYRACNIVGPMDQLNRMVRSYLDNLTLQELLFGTTPIELADFIADSRSPHGA